MQNSRDFALKNPYLPDQEAETEDFPASPHHSHHENGQPTDSSPFYDLSPLPALAEQEEPLSPPDSSLTRFPCRQPQKISGVHEKYLNETLSPLTKASFRSERKGGAGKRQPLTQRLAQKKDAPIDLAAIYEINPVSEGLRGLQIDAQQLRTELEGKLESEEGRGSCFLELGLKQPKVLGKARSERECVSIMAFLSSGQMPAEYVASFFALVGN